jgi:hypothetical protein
VSPKNDARSGTTSISGTNFGYYYTFSADDGDAVTYSNLDDSEYSIQWNNNSGYFIGGKGWNPGSAQSAFPPSQFFVHIRSPTNPRPGRSTSISSIPRAS